MNHHTEVGSVMMGREVDEGEGHGEEEGIYYGRGGNVCVRGV